MTRSVRIQPIALGLVVAVSAWGCASKYAKVEESFAQPINCSSAQADIAALEADKASKATQAAEGMKFALPTTIIMGAITGTAGSEYEVGTGEYNRKIDERMANIRSTCKLD
ncbi:MAG TPA: hypothetical protein VF948_03375 [Methylomirabilota bacterium]